MGSAHVDPLGMSGQILAPRFSEWLRPALESAGVITYCPGHEMVLGECCFG
jgi:hypothetical protein